MAQKKQMKRGRKPEPKATDANAIPIGRPHPGHPRCEINTAEHTPFNDNRSNIVDFDQYRDHQYNARAESASLYMASRRGNSPMTNRWRTEGNPRNRNNHGPPRDRGGRSRSPPPRRETHPAGRGRLDRDKYPPRQHRKRDFSPEPRRPPPRRPSLSPARSPRLPPGRSRYPHDSAYTSRDSSPTRFAKRRRTRSPSASDWSDRGFSPRRKYSRSRSRERYEHRDRSGSRRGFSPRRASPPPPPRGARPVSRALGPEVDTYIPDRRRPASPPRRGPRRSPSPRPRSLTPPFRRRSITPPRRYDSRPGSPLARYASPQPDRTRPPRDITPEPAFRRKPGSRTSSVAGDLGQESMDGSFAIRGHHGHSEYIPRGRGRGQRPYQNTRGSFRGSPVAATPSSSHQGSPQSESSYRGGRGGWNGAQQPFQQQK